MLVRHCPKCGFAKTTPLFCPSSSWCKACKRSAAKSKYAALAPAKRRKHNEKKKVAEYGITEADYQTLLLQQSGVCAICFRPESIKDHLTGVPRQLAIDHCHATSKVRGLLCGNCNQALGKFNDNPDLLRAAANYLELAAQSAQIIGS